MITASLLLSLLALSIVSMDLALAVVLHKTNHQKWTKWFVVFVASLLGLVLLFILEQLSSILFDSTARYVLHLVWSVFITADASFLIAFAWYFINFLIARPMPKWEKFLAYIDGLLYLACSVLYEIFPFYGISSAKYVVGLAAILYSVGIIIKHYRSIDNHRVKIVCMTVVWVSLAVVILQVLTIVLPFLMHLLLPIMALSYLICFFVFLCIALDIPLVETKEDKFMRKELSIEDVQTYGITQREFEVIQLIKKGLTNKEIASELSISVNTVNNHIANIFDKTEVRSRIDLLNLLQEAEW